MLLSRPSRPPTPGSTWTPYWTPWAERSGSETAETPAQPGLPKVGETGFEPATARPPAGCATRLRHSPWCSLASERATGIEPALRAWKAPVQPQHFARQRPTLYRDRHSQPARLKRQKRTEQIAAMTRRSEEHTSELQSRQYLVCRLLLEKKKKK